MEPQTSQTTKAILRKKKAGGHKPPAFETQLSKQYGTGIRPVMQILEQNLSLRNKKIQNRPTNTYEGNQDHSVEKTSSPIDRTGKIILNIKVDSLYYTDIYLKLP